MRKVGLIAIFLPSLRGGGAERVMVVLANGLIEKGFQIDLVVGCAEGPYFNDVDKRVRIVNLQRRRILFCLPGLVRYLRNNEPIAMISALSHANVVAIWAKYISMINFKLVVSEHSSVTARRIASRLSVGGILPRFIKWFYPKADAIVAVSEGAAEALSEVMSVNKDRINVVYNPVFSDRLIALSQEKISHPWFSIGQPPVILSAGRLSKAKNFQNLIEAFGILRERREARLLILGEGELRKEIESLIESHPFKEDICLGGFVKNPYPFMKSASVFVVSSDWEGLSNVLVEAMATGTPVVSTNCPSGPSEILEDGKWGRLVSVGDPVALAGAIEISLDQAIHPDVLFRAKQFGINQAIDGYLRAICACL